MSAPQRIWQITLAIATAGMLIVLSPQFIPSGRVVLRSAPAIAQSRVQDAAKQVYEQVPDLPLENQYVNRVTNQVDPNNTLVTRLVRYHQYIKGRPLGFRLDWKMTLADYLGINEPIIESSYPGSDNLKQNPFERDRAIINRLDRKQRDALIQALVNVFNPAAKQPVFRSQPASQTPTVAPSPTLPQPGGAQLLLPSK
jgi:hypothetical protein